MKQGCVLVIIKISHPPPPPPLRKEGKVEMNRFCGFVSDALLRTCAVAVASEGENWCFAVETTREY